jgi:hypothetical protein
MLTQIYALPAVCSTLVCIQVSQKLRRHAEDLAVNPALAPGYARIAAVLLQRRAHDRASEEFTLLMQSPRGAVCKAASKRAVYEDENAHLSP